MCGITAPATSIREAPGGPITHRAYRGRDDIFALFIDDPLVAPQGERVSYSSFGYTLASFVMEAAAGSSSPSWYGKKWPPRSACPAWCRTMLDLVPLRARGYFSAKEIEFIASKMPGVPPPKLSGAFANVNLSNPAFCWAGGGFPDEHAGTRPLRRGPARRS